MSDKPTYGLAVDGFCSGNPGKGGYRGVDIATGEQLFICTDLENTTNNISEFIGLIHALGFIKIRGKEDPSKHYSVVYTDSQTAIVWYKKKDVNTSGKLCEITKCKLDRSLRWLSEQRSLPEVLKWDTEKWGEIPADFGNKK